MDQVHPSQLRLLPPRALIVATPGRGSTFAAQAVIRNSRASAAAALVMGRPIDQSRYEEISTCTAFRMGDGQLDFNAVRAKLFGETRPMLVIDTFLGLLNELSRRPHKEMDAIGEWFDFLDRIGPVPGVMVYRYTYEVAPSLFDRIINSFLGNPEGESKAFLSQVRQGSLRFEPYSFEPTPQLWWVEADRVSSVVF